MSTCLRRAAVVAGAVSMAVGLVACGTAADEPAGGTSAEGGFAIGLLFPENQTARYETFDRPLIEKKIKELCADCTVEYANAHGDVAIQHLQVDAMITKGVQALILDPADTRSLRSAVMDAAEADIPVVSYDRLVEGPVSAFVSYSGENIVRMQGQALLKAIGDKANGGRIVRVEGPLVSREHLALPIFEGKAEIVGTYQAAAWNAENAYTTMSGAIAALGIDNIDGVLAANDALAAGVITALKDAHIKPLPPVTGQDAELTAVQRIVNGEQLMTVYKPYKPEADTAAEMAVALGRGENIDNLAEERMSTPTTKNIPSVLLTPTPVDVHNIKNTVVKDGTYTLDEICVPDLRSACERAGLID